MSSSLQYLITHIFLPPELPQTSDSGPQNDHYLVNKIFNTSQKFVSLSPGPEWDTMVKMLKNLSRTVHRDALEPDEVRSQISRMEIGGKSYDVLAFMIRCQNAAVILRKTSSGVNFESFEMSPANEAVMKAQGKLIISYSGPAITVPLSTVDDPSFLKTLSDFLSEMNGDVLDSTPTTTKAGSEVIEIRDTADPRYITDLLTGILRGCGEIADIPRIRKRIADDVLWHNALLPWRRSPLWLTIRVVFQTSLHRVSGNHDQYKIFMLFLMVSLLEDALAAQPELPSDLLFIMRVKVARRLKKISIVVPNFVLNLVDKVTMEVEVVLQTRWREIEAEQSRPHPWSPQDLNYSADTKLTLQHCGDYLRQVVENNSAGPQPQSPWNPPEIPRFQTMGDYISDDMSAYSSRFKSDALMLADFELAVRSSLDDWVKMNIHNESACSALSSILNSYKDSSVTFYRGNPEESSIMLLTMGELWVALDRIVLHHCPLLERYSPELSESIFDSLLLRTEEQLSRLAGIQIYIQSRHDGRDINYPSVFTETFSKWTFSVRFFDSSRMLQGEYHAMVQKADAEREEKKREVQRKNLEYQRLKSKAEAMSHDACYYNCRGKRISNGCSKCAVESQISNFPSLMVHEWPLPNSELEAKATVFELYGPPVYWAWRDATYGFLHDLCTTDSPTQSSPPNTLEQYYRHNKARRITFASRTKSFIQSHYRERRDWPVDFNSVCVNNGLQLALYDFSTGSWVRNVSRAASVAHHCTFKLSQGPYSQLQHYIDSTAHTSNDVVASQCKCPPELSLHEHLAFGCLRSGPLLQWLNILKEIRARDLSFGNNEVYMLLLQSSTQVGPLLGALDRQWHAELQIPGYRDALLRELDDLVESFGGNWSFSIAIQCAIALTLRTLAIVDERTSFPGAFALLRRARSMALHWVYELKKVLQVTTEEASIRELRQLLVQAAVICKQTYDVSLVHLPNLLSSREDISDYIFCSIIIYDNSSSASAPDPVGLLARDRRLSHRIERNICDNILKDSQGMDNAISRVWDGYDSEAVSWKCDSPTSSWLASFDVRDQSGQSQKIHFNLREGQLLVDGKTVGCLPRDVINHPTFKLVLGDIVLDVVPPRPGMYGMDFSARNEHFGHQLHFLLRKSDGELVIRAQAGSRLLELIPPHHFRDDLPEFFSMDYIPWMEISTSEIEFRPLESRWKSSNDNWRLYFSTHGGSIMSQCGRGLIDPYSRTAKMISRRLDPIEYSKYHIITTGIEENSLSVDLPRLELNFFVDEKLELQSRNFRDMIVAHRQSSGTMLGLRSQLILRPNNFTALRLSRSRVVLIPRGTVSVQRDRHHAIVQVDTSKLSTVKIERYNIDSDLGQLVGNVGQMSKLYRAYLHALSSHCLPDQLLEHTGIEEAMRILQSAGCMSFQSLEAEEVEMLNRIANLVPARAFYPVHCKVMQDVQPSPVPILSQYYGLYEASKSIIDHATRLQIFSQSSFFSLFRSNSESEAHLQKRAALRKAVYFPMTAGSQVSSADIDMVYKSRDLPSDHEAEIHSFAVIGCSWPSKLCTTHDLLSDITAWGKLAAAAKDFPLDYTNAWLKPCLHKIWLSWYNYCRSSQHEHVQYDIVFALSAMAYGTPETKGLLPTLLAFATTPYFKRLAAPDYPDYDFSYGFEPTRNNVLNIINSNSDYERSPEYGLAQRHGESMYSLHQRRQQEFEDKSDEQRKTMIKEILDKWPSETIPPLRSVYEARFKTGPIIQEVNIVFRKCYHNLKLREHIGAVQRELDCIHSDQSSQMLHYQIPSASYCMIGSTNPISISTMGSLFSSVRAPSYLQHPPYTTLGVAHTTGQDSDLDVSSASDSRASLTSLTAEFRSNDDIFFRRYGEDLEKSREHLDTESHAVSYQSPAHTLEEVIQYHASWQAYFSYISSAFKRSLIPSEDDLPNHILHRAGLWPRLGLMSFLKYLASTCSEQDILPSSWKDALMSAGKALLSFQQSQRLLSFHLSGNRDDFDKELANMSVLENSFNELTGDWLLIQLECGFLVRNVQIDVARHMISPPSRANTSLQLNMGEGKSSVIVPLIATSLADGERLVRVIVLKSLAKQMFQLLVDRLGGMVGRRVFYMPFSRNITVGLGEARAIQAMNEECRKVSGILVIQPDHILSYKLMGIDRQLSHLSSETEVVNTLLESQKWLDRNTRDIIDEADEILHVRYQLLYTVGNQSALECSPHRWLLVQEVLQIIKDRAPTFKCRFPDGIQLEQSEGKQFPFIRFLQDDVADAMILQIANDVANGALEGHYTFGVAGAFSACLRRAKASQSGYLARRKCDRARQCVTQA